MKRLLVFVGGYYPSYGAPGIVLEKLLPTLKSHFDITIITVRRKRHALGNPFACNGIEVYEVSDWIQDRCVESRGVLRLFWRFVQEIGNAVARQPMFAYDLRHTVRLANRLHAVKRFDAVLSVSFPPYAHIAAQEFVSHRSDLPWVAYSTDTLFGHKLLKSKWYGWQMRYVLAKEMGAYEKAKDVFLTPEIYAWAGRMFPNGDVRPKKLEYTLNLDAAAGEEEIGEFAEDGVHFVYAGVFYERIRDPRWFLSVIKSVLQKSKRNLCFHFYLVTDVFRSEIVALRTCFPKNVIVHSAVPPTEVKRIMNAADILLNFSNDADQFSPSKLFDYVSTGRPVLNIAYPSRKINTVIGKYPYALTLVNDGPKEPSADRILSFVDAFAGRRLPVAEIKATYPEYLSENVARQLVEALS